MWNKNEEKYLTQNMGKIEGRTRAIEILADKVIKSGNTKLNSIELQRYKKYSANLPFLAGIYVDESEDNKLVFDRVIPLSDFIEINLEKIPESYLYKFARTAGFKKEDIDDIDDWRELHNFTTEFIITDKLFQELLKTLGVSIKPSHLLYFNKFIIDEGINISEVTTIENWGICSGRELKLFDYAE